MAIHGSKHICGAEALEKIDRHLRSTGKKLTDIRREIILKMADLSEPKTAYQILDAANKSRRTKLSAISLYRTLDFLIEAGVVLKLESKNAYELCLNETPEHSHLMMVCEKCGHVREIYDHELAETLAKAAKKHGHKLKHHVIELHGTCREC